MNIENKMDKEKFVIPVIDLYTKEVGDRNGKNRITTHAYKIRIYPKNTQMLKKTFCAKFPTKEI